MARRLQHEEHLQAAAAARAMPLDMFGPGGPGALPEPPAFLRGGRASWMPPPPPPAGFDRRDPDRHDATTVPVPPPLLPLLPLLLTTRRTTRRRHRCRRTRRWLWARGSLAARRCRPEWEEEE